MGNTVGATVLGRLSKNVYDLKDKHLVLAIFIAVGYMPIDVLMYPMQSLVAREIAAMREYKKILQHLPYLVHNKGYVSTPLARLFWTLLLNREIWMYTHMHQYPVALL